ncbi:MAG: gamma-glutamyltransferase [Sulfuriflexus sp.]|nr:gamma-glutamyltransferase [Sulfuriflexus sp.]
MREWERVILLRNVLIACLVSFNCASVLAQSLPHAGIATAHPLATQAGHQILAQGGNAFDAAVAVTATLAVVEPYSSGLGGGGFWLLHRASDGMQVMLDGREMAPGRAHRDMYLDDAGNVRSGASIDGPLAAGIPGVPAALEHLAHRYGKLPLATSLQPAIKAARNGFPVDAMYQRMVGFRLAALRASPAAAEIFLDKNETPKLGYKIRQLDLANTLEEIAEKGSNGFYRGHIAQRLVTGARDAGGIWCLEDLAKYHVIERKPVSGMIGQTKVISVPPPSSGGVALLSILQQIDGFSRFDRNTNFDHIVIESMRRAYRDRAEFLGDNDFVDVPVSRLISDAHADELRAGIDLNNATPSSELPAIAVSENAGTDTTHFSIMDREGNRVAATLSVNYPFGSGFVSPGTGVLLNDEMDDFSSKVGIPNIYGLVGAEANSIEARKRPLSSMSPSFIEMPRGVAVLGTPGGSRIITMVLNGILDYLNGGDANSMVSKRRYHHQYLPDEIQHERGAFSKSQADDLQLRGHILKERDDYGNMQVVLWERESNTLDAASDPRGVGSATVK